MAHIVGVPKREPCKHCGLPVFFAERLAIDGSFYHRKCLRCARCDSQLTPGSFYETEVDGVFCCETCPDEETKIRLGNNNVEHISELSPDEQRKSFSEKLAMFQTNGKGLLQKSLSDEEKSKSLKRLTELYSKNCVTHDANDIKQTMNDAGDGQKEEVVKKIDAKIDENEFSTSDNTDDENDKPPLPSTLPPLSPNRPAIEAIKPKLPPIPSKANVLNKLYGKVHQEKLINTITFDPKTIPQTNTEPSTATNVVNEQSSENATLNKSTNKEMDSETPNTPKYEEKLNSIENNLNINNSLPLDALNSFTNVTKENAEFIEASQLNANVLQLEEKNESNIDDDDSDDNDKNNVGSINMEQIINTKDVSQLEEIDLSMENESTKCEQERKQQKETEQVPTKVEEEINQQQQNVNGCNENKSIDTNLDNNDTNNIENITNLREQSSSISDNDSQKMVRSRLSQFEALVQTSDENKIAHHSPRLNRGSAILEKLTERKKSIEVDDKMNVIDATEVMGQLNVKLEPPSSPSILPTVNQLSLNTNDENNTDLITNINADSEKILNTMETNNLDINKPVPRQRAAINVSLDEEEDDASNNTTTIPPTPSKRKQKSTASNQLTDKNQMVKDNANNLDVDHKDLPECSLSSEDNEVKKDNVKYSNGLNCRVSTNPFGSDDEDGDVFDEQPSTSSKRKDSLNPFDSSDDEIELLKRNKTKKKLSNNRVSTNPFGSDSENETDTDSLSVKRTPVPTPRKPTNGPTLQATPEASPRMYNTLHPKMRLQVDDDLRGSNASLTTSTNNNRASYTLNRLSKVHGSMSSLASTPRHKKGRAPDIPLAKLSVSANSSPSHSVRATPVSKKKRAAPLPPKHQSMKGDIFAGSHFLAANLDDSMSSRYTISSESVVDLERSINFPTSAESNYVSSSNDMSLSSTERSNFLSADFKPSESSEQNSLNESTPKKMIEPVNAQRKLIPVDESLLDGLATEMSAEEEVTYRRKIIPDQIITPIKNDLHETTATDRQCEKMKENKESQNKNRQSQISLPSNAHDDSNQLYSPNKSSYGKWKRRKGPAPSLPIPPRKIIQMLPLQEIRHELEVIEVQQQGLEKQGVMLEKMIRERCEGTENENQPLNECKPNSKEVEDLILQLFELVNEKNELFRRQAELMYLRRQHRLEQEQADIEYEIRVLMAQPECNKTDSDKAREEALISRLVDVVQLRNEVIESLEMDRIREAEEDQSIKERLELHTAKRDEELCQQTPIKLSKKEKKKQKESKKLAKQKKMDADKDADESEISQAEKLKEKKKKKKFLF